MPKPFSSFGHCALYGEKESGAAWDRRGEGVTVPSCLGLGKWGEPGGQRQRGLALEDGGVLGYIPAVNLLTKLVLPAARVCRVGSTVLGRG